MPIANVNLDNSYDRVPYPSWPYAQSHPDRMAAIATLLGLHPCPVDNASVLELGCAAGGNLIPIAAMYPNSRFLGIDLSAREIAEGNERITTLGLRNIELRQAGHPRLSCPANSFFRHHPSLSRWNGVHNQNTLRFILPSPPELVSVERCSQPKHAAIHSSVTIRACLGGTVFTTKTRCDLFFRHRPSLSRWNGVHNQNTLRFILPSPSELVSVVAFSLTSKPMAVAEERSP